VKNVRTIITQEQKKSNRKSTSDFDPSTTCTSKPSKSSDVPSPRYAVVGISSSVKTPPAAHGNPQCFAQIGP
jgi:hypothetical protein